MTTSSEISGVVTAVTTNRTINPTKILLQVFGSSIMLKIIKKRIKGLAQVFVEVKIDNILTMGNSPRNDLREVEMSAMQTIRIKYLFTLFDSNILRLLNAVLIQANRRRYMAMFIKLKPLS